MLKDFSPTFLMVETLGAWKDIGIIAFNTPTGESIIYPPQDITGQPTRPLIATLDVLRVILLAFQKEKAIKILHEFWGRKFPFHYTLELIEPKFSELEQEIIQLYELKEGENALLGKVETSKSQNALTPDTAQLLTPSPDKELTCGLLKVNISQSTIQYKDNTVVEISTGNNIIKFLILLMENRRVVEYIKIAKELKLNFYHEGMANEEVAREVHFLRRDLINYLKTLGMSKTETQQMLVTKRNVGYKLRCSN